MRVVPLQTMPAAIEALKGKQVDAILLPQPFPGAAEAQGFGKILFWAGDLHPWQVATVFYSKKFAADRKRAVDFMKGYVKASRYYYDAVLVQKDGRPAHGANYDEVVRITAKYTEARPEVIRLGFPFQDRNGRLLVTDIERQMQWWTAQWLHEAHDSAQGYRGHVVRGGGRQGRPGEVNPSTQGALHAHAHDADRGLALLTLVLAGPAAALEVGQKAPDFTLAGIGGKQVKLADMLGKGPIVVYTFIQAFTGT